MVEEAAAKAEEAVEKMTTQPVLGRPPAQTKGRQRQAKQEVKVVYFRSFLDAEPDREPVILAPAEHPVQLAMFAL